MQNSSSLKSKPETPKTPGGISKCFLTPCRRVGLSRNWKKKIASPFHSPLISTEPKQENVETRKRKESLEDTLQKNENIESVELSENVGTPTRKVEMPRRKKSKTLLHSITRTAEDCSQPQSPNAEETEEKCVKGNENKEIVVMNVEAEVVSTPVRLKSKYKENAKVNAGDKVMPQVSSPLRLKSKSKNKKNISPTIRSRVKSPISTKANDEAMDIKKGDFENSITLSENKLIEKTNKTDNEKEKLDNIESNAKDRKVKSPNNLTKECIVVIQKKIFKEELKVQKLLDKNEQSKQNESQVLFNDSDSDEVPLNRLNRTETMNDMVKTITIDDDDFTTSKPKAKKTTPKRPVTKKFNLKGKTTAQNGSKDVKAVVNVQEHNILSQSSSDDDDIFEKKRTIIIRKTYDKVIKPLKAKSTGSITQKDIEDLKARIETKKKMVVAHSMQDSKELWELIKKWRKGCQDALMELMDLMKNKCPDQNMEYSQILQTLKIPAMLVGYDSDNDCFLTPDDENIILSMI
ncbi:Uncharacterized protein OBRU01_04828 [Operophtera brumata]|uniref:Swi5-dependent recombination DNA repair protein 1 homolog n=1 Tax=Operophtera brumata TaxID=104452 RepID=A0A0L7LP44_OPEBR|nr:Uncharacterized protein OBRU01_04828 [Operophtera brumata]